MGNSVVRSKMGRPKLKMEHICEEKSRITTFQKRKNSLMKKVYELTILCDVSACIIINGPTQNGGPPKTEIWPSNLDKVQDIINTYKHHKVKQCGIRTFEISDFFEERDTKMEYELKKARKQNMGARYPTWFDFMNNYSDNHLRDFAIMLNKKLDAAKARVELMKRNQSSRLASSPTSTNSLMMLVMNDNDFVQLSGASHRTPYTLPSKHEHCCDSMPGVIESVIDENNTPRMVMKYYSPTLKPSPQYIRRSIRSSYQVHGSQVSEYADY
ncbi:hypothetical protein LguiA_027013 [Lonicera macranthoides]